MSRTKKSRTPGGAPTAKPKLSKQELEKVEKRIRKKKGKQAGNRQIEAMQKSTSNAENQGNKDPRLGNKTPIELKPMAKKVEQKTNKAKQNKQASPIAAIHFAENDNVDKDQSLQTELANIESDQELQSILAKIDEDTALTEEEVYYYNDKMDRHQAISTELGLDDDDDAEDESSTRGQSEDDLWDKLDNQDFSKYE